jgi:hypothetical protein
MSLTVKREVILRAVVTDQLKKELTEELQAAAAELDQRIGQIDLSTRAYITNLQRADLQQAMAVRKRVDAEKARHQELRDAIMERMKQVAVLDNDTEVIRGTLESFVDVEVGDDLAMLLNGTEVVVKDGVVIEIRQRRPEAQKDEKPVLEIVTELPSSGQNG